MDPAVPEKWLYLTSFSDPDLPVGCGMRGSESRPVSPNIWALSVNNEHRDSRWSLVRQSVLGGSWHARSICKHKQAGVMAQLT